LRIVYTAIDQTVPGSVGGSVHVQAVAEGLAALGHEVHALAAPGATPLRVSGVHWYPVAAPGGRPQLRLLRSAAVRRIVDRVRPHVVIERYHNFGGEGVRAARAAGARLVLEVNAPIVDHPGSRKRLLDRALIVEPLRRWRDWQCAHADLFVTPTRAVLPEWIPSARVLELEWGADTDRFRPGLRAPLPFQRPPGLLAVFAGAFRAWHGAIHLVEAIRQLRSQGMQDVSAVFVGRGPELEAVREAARDLPVVFTGALPHEAVPAVLASADVGVAPFDASRHGPLAIDFYWSPLKVFEYMASGLPVVTPRLPRLARLVDDGREGILYDPSVPGALAAALKDLRDAAVRERMGTAARARVVRDFSWRAHCARLGASLAALAPHDEVA
jgi:glycosyltransferase involved in cell wall biosynthesis